MVILRNSWNFNFMRLFISKSWLIFTEQPLIIEIHKTTIQNTVFVYWKAAQCIIHLHDCRSSSKISWNGNLVNTTNVPGYRCSSPSERSSGGESGSVGLNRGPSSEWVPIECSVSREKPKGWHLNSSKNRVKSSCD